MLFKWIATSSTQLSGVGKEHNHREERSTGSELDQLEEGGQFGWPASLKVQARAGRADRFCCNK